MTYSILYAFLAIAAFGVGYVTALERKRGSLCDKCVNLKRNGGGGVHKYYCSNLYIGGFDKPPEYCSMFKRRG